MPGERAVITGEDMPEVGQGKLAPLAGKVALPAATSLKDALADEAPFVHASRDSQEDQY